MKRLAPIATASNTMPENVRARRMVGLRCCPGGVTGGEGLERFAHRHPPPPTLFLQRRLLPLETLLPVHVLTDAEDHPTVRFDDPNELVERFGWGVVRCEDAYRDGGREGAVLETEGLTEHHAVQAAVGILLASFLKHTLGDVYPHEVFVAQHAQDASEQAGTRTGIQHRSPERYVAAYEPGRHGGYRIAQAQHIAFVILRPLVVSARQLTVVAGRVDVL